MIKRITVTEGTKLPLTGKAVAVFKCKKGALEMKNINDVIIIIRFLVGF